MQQVKYLVGKFIFLCDTGRKWSGVLELSFYCSGELLQLWPLPPFPTQQVRDPDLQESPVWMQCGWDHNKEHNKEWGHDKLSVRSQQGWWDHMGEGWAISEYLPHPPAILYSLPCFVFDMMWKWENAKRNGVLASAVGFFICYFLLVFFYLPSAVAVVPGGQSLHRGTGRSLILVLQHCWSLQWNIYFCIFEQQHHRIIILSGFVHFDSIR